MVTVALNHKKIKSHPESVWNIKPFINKYNWEGINYLLKLDDWQRFRKNNPAIADSILYTKDKVIISDYVSKHNLTCEKQIILLMITNKEKEGWQYLAVKKLLALLHKNLQIVRVIFTV